MVAGFGNVIGGAVVCPVDPDFGCTAVFVAPVVEALLGTFIVRELFTPFGHSLFTMMIGIGLGIAINARNPLVRIVAPIIGFGLAVALHATFNAGFGMAGITLGFVVVFLVAVGAVVFQRRREQRIIAAELPGMAQAGWIAPGEVPLLQSLAGRQGWRRHVQQRLGKPGSKAIQAYQAAVTELAILRHRMARGALGPQARPWHDELLHDVHAARAAAPPARRRYEFAHRLKSRRRG